MEEKINKKINECQLLIEMLTNNDNNNDNYSRMLK